MPRQLVLAGVLLVIGCPPAKQPEEQTSKGPVAATNPARPECGDSLAIPLPDRIILKAMPLAGPISDVPEYHDCQALLSGASADYGPLVAIYARYHLDSVYASDRFKHSQEPTPVAEIYSYNGDYPQLGIKQGFNCLDLRRVDGAWNARIRAMGPTQPDCTTVHATDAATILPVQETAMPHAADADYPPVARWDWDSGDPASPDSAHQYIGIKCGTSWCDVGTDRPRPTSAAAGRPGFDPMPNRPPAPALKRERVSSIKGWYDEQYLADADGSGALHRGAFLAQVYPHPQNDEVNTTAAFGAVWRPSAYVMLPAGRHYDKLHLGPGQNTIYLCQGTGCTGVTPAVKCAASEDGLVWYARITPSQGPVALTCVTRRAHANVEMPATARWRWVSKDEKVWIRCASGCCTVE